MPTVLALYGFVYLCCYRYAVQVTAQSSNATLLASQKQSGVHQAWLLLAIVSGLEGVQPQPVGAAAGLTCCKAVCTPVPIDLGLSKHTNKYY